MSNQLWILYDTYMASSYAKVIADCHFSLGVYATEELGNHSAPWKSRSLAHLTLL